MDARVCASVVQSRADRGSRGAREIGRELVQSARTPRGSDACQLAWASGVTGGGTLTSVQSPKCRLEISLKIEEANAPLIITTEGQLAGRKLTGLRLCSSQLPLAAASGSGSVFRGRR